jgi:hypothetical protein
MNDTYDEVYKNLNKEQKEAVESIDGPVMVVAGPGTGKDANTGFADWKYFKKDRYNA